MVFTVLTDGTKRVCLKPVECVSCDGFITSHGFNGALDTWFQTTACVSAHISVTTKCSFEISQILRPLIVFIIKFGIETADCKCAV